MQTSTQVTHPSIHVGTRTGAGTARRATAAALAAAIALSGCATSSSNVAASYTSPMQYQSYDCAQLQAEAQRIHSRVNQLAGRLDEAATNDKVLMGVGLVLFWPALFALGGTKQQEADYARLKGEYDAIQQAAIAKKCELGAGASASASASASANVNPNAGASAGTAANAAPASGSPASPASAPQPQPAAPGTGQP